MISQHFADLAHWIEGSIILDYLTQTNNAKEYLIAQTKEPKTTKHKNTWEIYNAKKGMG